MTVAIFENHSIMEGKFCFSVSLNPASEKYGGITEAVGYVYLPSNKS
jgi:hypothetical protein